MGTTESNSIMEIYWWDSIGTHLTSKFFMKYQHKWIKLMCGYPILSRYKL